MEEQESKTGCPVARAFVWPLSYCMGVEISLALIIVSALYATTSSAYNCGNVKNVGKVESITHLELRRTWQLDQVWWQGQGYLRLWRETSGHGVWGDHGGCIVGLLYIRHSIHIVTLSQDDSDMQRKYVKLKLKNIRVSGKLLRNEIFARKRN